MKKIAIFGGSFNPPGKHHFPPSISSLDLFVNKILSFTSRQTLPSVCPGVFIIFIFGALWGATYEMTVIYYGGVGAMTVFPEDEKLLVNGGDKIGIIGWNSVNKTSSVIIKFCVRHKDTYITMPKLIAGFKRMHVGKAIQITQNFLVVVDKVREVWKQILTEFEKIKVSETYVTAMLDELGIKDKSLRKQVLKELEFKEEMDLWDVFMKMIAVIEDRNYKSDIHRRKRLDKISADIFKWAVAGRLINA